MGTVTPETASAVPKRYDAYRQSRMASANRRWHVDFDSRRSLVTPPVIHQPRSRIDVPASLAGRTDYLAVEVAVAYGELS